MAKPRVKAPKRAQKGEVVTLKTLISHKMESGQRKDKNGNLIPRQIINRFTCTYNGDMVVDAKLEPSISTNPYLAFQATCAKVPGAFEFTWYDDNGEVYTSTKKVKKG